MTQATPYLKLAESGDWSSVLRMARKFHEGSPFRDLVFSEERLFEVFNQYLSDPKSLIFILVEVDQLPVGMIVGYASQLPFSEDIVSGEIAWWVDEDYRHSRYSLLLFRAYEEWSRRVGAKMNQVAMINEMTDISKFYERNGYRLAEQSYVRKNHDL